MIPNTDRTNFLLLKQFYQFLDSTLANVSFQDKLKIKQISLAIKRAPKGQRNENEDRDEKTWKTKINEEYCRKTKTAKTGELGNRNSQRTKSKEMKT